ncbi:hypothetical protein F5Y14DRAFT_408622 [Nemania sp. NC0429]|nr:hypothetical protein F5Y14DRAFT_408622 [Nemania sp. NC0429]
MLCNLDGMTSPMPPFRGFTHPLVLLVRSCTLRSRYSLESSIRNATSRPAPLSSPSRHRTQFTSCRALYSTIKKANTPPTGPKPSKPVAVGPLAEKTHPLAPYGDGYARRLAMKSRPTLLYEAPPQTAFLISSYAAGLFCFGGAAINSWFNVFNLPPGISPWVAVGFGVVSFIFAALGTTFALRPSSIIRSIKLLPNAAPQQAPGSPIQPVKLEVVARRVSIVPLPLKRMQVTPEQVAIVNRMQNLPIVLTREQLAAKQREDARRKKEERQYELDHLMTAPFRDAGRASSSLLANIRRGLTNEGFAPVYIDGIQYKLDVEGGYSLENGKVLDRIVRFQPDPKLASIQSKG